MPIRCEIVSQDRLVFEGEVDIVVADGASLEGLVRQPDFVNEYKILARLSDPAPLLVYDPARLGSDRDKRLALALCNPSSGFLPSPWEMLTGKIFGIRSFSEPTPRYREQLQLLEKSLANYRECFLPIYFY